MVANTVMNAVTDVTRSRCWEDGGGIVMRVRRFVAALLVWLVIGVSATPALAASLTYPSSVTYADTPALTVSGLKAKSDYLLLIYDRFEQPRFTIPFTSDADGRYVIPDFHPDPTDLPGMYTFVVVNAADSTTVATATVTLNGENRWFLNTRLGS